MLPSSQKALVIQSKGVAELVTDRKIPTLRNGYILVKTVAVALNPTDWKHIDFLPKEGALVGCDYAGTVVEVGSGVTTKWEKGDRIAGAVHGSSHLEPEDGAFAEYIVAKGDVQMPIPKNLSFEEASTLGIGITTVGQALYQSLKLPLPTEPAKDSFPILIYGGSSATGTLAIQYAKLSGLTVVATASTRNFALCKSLGADAVFDYNDPTCAEQIKKFTDNKLKYAMDCISIESSAAICADALSSSPGSIYTTLLPIKSPRSDVESKNTLAYSLFGEEVLFGDRNVPASKEDFEFGKMFWALATKLLGEGKIKVHKPTVRSGGLGGVLSGLQELKENKISGEKLVYVI